MNAKRELVGKVVSNVNKDTITIVVETYGVDALYGKRVKKSKKYAAHDPKNEANVGDVVRVRECRPMSKTKCFRLVEIVEKAVIL